MEKTSSEGCMHFFLITCKQLKEMHQTRPVVAERVAERIASDSAEAIGAPHVNQRRLEKILPILIAHVFAEPKIGRKLFAN